MTGGREKGLEAGMDDYSAKPFKRNQLRGIIARWSREADKSGAGLPG